MAAAARRAARWLAGGAALLAAVLSAASPSPAHPHVFVEVGFTLRFGPAGVDAVAVTWTFDDVTSDALLPDYDPKHTGKLTAKAAKAIEEDLFRPMADGGFMTEIAVDGVPVPVSAPRGFTARIVKGLLVFTFDAPLPHPVTAGVLTLRGWDPEYYVAFTHAQGTTTSGPARPIRCEHRREPRDTDVTGPIEADGVVCTVARPTS